MPRKQTFNLWNIYNFPSHHVIILKVFESWPHDNFQAIWAKTSCVNWEPIKKHTLNLGVKLAINLQGQDDKLLSSINTVYYMTSNRFFERFWYTTTWTTCFGFQVYTCNSIKQINFRCMLPETDSMYNSSQQWE